MKTKTVKQSNTSGVNNSSSGYSSSFGVPYQSVVPVTYIDPTVAAAQTASGVNNPPPWNPPVSQTPTTEEGIRAKELERKINALGFSFGTGVLLG